MSTMSATSTSALSSLEAMLASLMRGHGGGGHDENTPVDDPCLAVAAAASTRATNPARPASFALPGNQARRVMDHVAAAAFEDASTATYDSLLAELQHKAAEVEARLRQEEDENAALKRRIESFHVEWLKRKIKIKSMEEACQEQMAALQAVQHTKAARTDVETPRDRRGSLESLMKMSEEPPARPRHGAGARQSSAVSRESRASRRESQALDRGAKAFVDSSMPWQPGAPSANFVDGIRKLEAQFSVWKKGYKARLRTAKADLDKEKRRRGGCWI